MNCGEDHKEERVVSKRDRVVAHAISYSATPKTPLSTLEIQKIVGRTVFDPSRLTLLDLSSTSY